MSKAKFTPGPWHVGPSDIYAEGTEASDFDDIVICAIGRAGLRSHEYAVVQAHKPQGRANARLVAEAPAMYDALTDILIQCRPGSRTHSSIGAILSRIDGDSGDA